MSNSYRIVVAGKCAMEVILQYYNNLHEMKSVRSVN